MVQFKLNMPAELRRKLGEASERTGRSLTAEVIARLEQSLEQDDEWSNALENIDDAILRIEKLEKLERRVASLEYSVTGLQRFVIPEAVEAASKLFPEES